MAINIVKKENMLINFLKYKVGLKYIQIGSNLPIFLPISFGIVMLSILLYNIISRGGFGLPNFGQLTEAFKKARLGDLNGGLNLNIPGLNND